MNIAVGSIVTSAKGLSREVLKVHGVRIVIADNDGNLKIINRDRVVEVLHPDPRNAVTIVGGRVEVDQNRLSLDYQPLTPIPQWEPIVKLKPYQSLSKLYIDIETTGLDAKVDLVLMVGLLNDRGEKTILTDPDEKILLAQTIEHLKQHQPECLIGHNLINFDLPFLADRCRIHDISHPFRKGNKTSRITSSTVNGKPIEFTPIYWSDVNILDTYQQIAIWDKQAAKLDRYDLKSSVIALGLRDDRRLELSVYQIRECWESGDTETIENYLKFDLDDTQLLAEFLLPVVYYQLAYVPKLSFQQIAIGSPALKAQKIHEKLLPRLNPRSRMSRLNMRVVRSN
jgi:DNA polymerase, archaea type